MAVVGFFSIGRSLWSAIMTRRYRIRYRRPRPRRSRLLRGHVAMDVIEDIARDCFEEWIARDLKRVEISVSELRLVVKHFLEMRHVPEASTE